LLILTVEDDFVINPLKLLIYDKVENALRPLHNQYCYLFLITSLKLTDSYITIYHASISNFIFITFSHRYSWFENR